MTMKSKAVGLILLISFITRSFLACITELNNDEVYYWTYAQKLQWNYFDHPPGIAVLLKIFTINLLFQHEFFLRLGSIICAAISTWLIYLISKKIKNPLAGLIAAILFTASPYCSIIAGLLVIPDAPQLVFWLASVLLMLKIIDPHVRKPKLRSRLLLLGVTIGCCILCKVHGIFLWAGFFSYIILFHRKLLRNPFLFYAGFISTIIVSPIVLWNFSNNFISYRYHSNRVSFSGAMHPDSFFRELGGEAIYNNPVIFVLLLLALTAVVKKQSFMPAPQQRLLLLLSLPAISLVLFMAIFRDTLPHWTGPAYTTLIPLLAAYLAARQIKIEQWVIPASAKWALMFTIVLLFPVIIIIKWLPYNAGNKEWNHLGEGDPTLDMNGFKKFGNQFDSLYKEDISEGRIGKAAFLLSDFWFPAAHIDYYVARPGKINFMAVGNITSIHHYAWLNKERPSLQPGADAYFITVSNYFHSPPAKLTAQFGKTWPPVIITQYRAGAAVRNFFIFRLTGYRGGIPGDGILN